MSGTGQPSRASRLPLLAALAGLAIGSGVLQFPALDGIGHDQGDPEAALEVVEFLDFGCPECARFGEETLPIIRREFIETGRVRWKYVPFVLGSFRHSERAAEAAQCAAYQGAFRPMHDRLLGGQRDWTRARRPDSTFLAYAAELGLSVPALAECLREKRARAELKTHRRLARKYGVRGTPTFYLDRRERVEGALSPALFREVLERRLAEGVSPL